MFGLPHWMRVPVRLLISAILALGLFSLLAYVGISILSAHILTSPRGPAEALDPRFVGPHPRRWRMRTADGLTLRGWYFAAAPQRDLIVCIHGMDDTWANMAGIGHDLRQLGYSVLLFDLRGHGESDRARISMGRNERADLRAVLDWALKRGFTPEHIGWVGASMGASTILMEGGRNHDIRAAVLDCPYGNLPELLDQQLAQHSGLPRIFNPGILLAARLVFGVRTDDLIPIQSATRWRDRPLLVIHGEADSIVPVRQGREIAIAAGTNCRLVTLPGIEHVQCYASNPRRYMATIDRFFRQHLGSAADEWTRSQAQTTPITQEPAAHSEANHLERASYSHQPWSETDKGPMLEPRWPTDERRSSL